MSLLKTNISPPFNITRLSHVALTSKDLDRTRFFYETGLGLEVTFQDNDYLCLRALEETSHHSLIFERSDVSKCKRIGYRVSEQDELAKAYDYFSNLQYEVNYVDRPYQGKSLHVSDIMGTPIEFCSTMEQKPSQMQNFHSHSGGKLAFLDHVQITSPDVTKVYEWYNSIGFRLAEYTANDNSDEMWGVWLKRKNNTQDVVFSNGFGPCLHHFAFHTPEVSNVIHAADVMASLDLGHTIDRPPGRHGIGNAFFIYFRDPDDHRIEIFTSHYNLIDANQTPKRWDLSDTRRSQLWGFPAPKKWFYETTEFENVKPKKPNLSAPPVTLEDFLEKW